MKQVVTDVCAFYAKMGFTAGKEIPPNLSDDTKKWLRLVMEEFMETFRATLAHAPDDKTFIQIQFHLESALSACQVDKGDDQMEKLAEIADGLVDLIYVSVGMALKLGIPLEEVWDEVHKINMAKDRKYVRPDGKVVKPPEWKPPAIKTLLKEAERRLG